MLLTVATKAENRFLVGAMGHVITFADAGRVDARRWHAPGRPVPSGWIAACGERLLTVPVYMPGVKGGAGDREASTRWCLLRNLRPHRLRFYALTYPFGFSTNFVAEPASNSA